VFLKVVRLVLGYGGVRKIYQLSKFCACQKSKKPDEKAKIAKFLD